MKAPGRIGQALLLLVAVFGWLGLALQLLVSMRVAGANGHSALRGAARSMRCAI